MCFDAGATGKRIEYDGIERNVQNNDSNHNNRIIMPKKWVYKRCVPIFFASIIIIICLNTYEYIHRTHIHMYYNSVCSFDAHRDFSSQVE